MNGTKIQFSPAEQELINDAEIILTKNRIMQKVWLLLEKLQDDMIQYKEQEGLNAELFKIPPKISKGENYSGLPYLILDYPRNFNGNNIIAIRTMFWWGNFFSSTLHVCGNYKEFVIEKIYSNHDGLAKRNYFINISEDPWQHHFQNDNYKLISLISKADFNKQLYQNNHVKLAAKWQLKELELMKNTLFESWKFLVTLI